MSVPILSLPGPTGAIEFDAAGLQGTWTEEQYLRLTARTNRLVELIDGRLEALPMPISAKPYAQLSTPCLRKSS